MQDNLQEEVIRQHAYLLWEAEGRLPDRDEHYWHLAASQLLVERIAPEAVRIGEAPEGAGSRPISKRKSMRSVGAKSAAEIVDAKEVAVKATPVDSETHSEVAKLGKVERKRPSKKKLAADASRIRNEA